MNLRRPATMLAIIAALCTLTSIPAFAQLLQPAGAGGGGYMWAAAFHPTDPQTIVYGADVGGIYKTVDYGQSWFKWTEGLANKDLGHSFYVEDLIGVSWDAGAREGFFAATRGGVYYRDHSGSAWQYLTPVDDPGDPYWYTPSNGTAIPLPFSCFSFDDENQRLYVGAGYERFTPFQSVDLIGAGQSTVWTMDLSGAPTPGGFTAMAGTDTLGSARDITVMSKNGRTYIAVATGKGIYFKKTPGPTTWFLVNSATDCWSVHITERGSLYGAFENGAVKVIPNVNVGFGDNDWVTVDRTSGPGPAPHTAKRVSERADLFNLTVFDGTGDGDDILYLGGWTLGGNLLHGGLYRCEVNGTEAIPTDLEWMHWIYKTTPWNPPTFFYQKLTGGPDVTFDGGYLPFVELDMPVEPAVFAGDPDRVFIHTSGRAHVYDGPNDAWVNAYSTDIHGDGTGWQSHGWNELSTRDIAFYKDGQGRNQIVTANGDIGTLRSTGNTGPGYAFEFDNPAQWTGVNDIWWRGSPYVDYRENWNGGGEGAIFAVFGRVTKSNAPSKFFMWRASQNPSWQNIGEDAGGGGFETQVTYQDFCFVDDQTVFLLYTHYDQSLLNNPAAATIDSAGVLKGTYTGGAWSWEHWNNGLQDPALNNHPYIWGREIMYNPATGMVFVAAAYRKVNGIDTQSGLFYLADPAVNQWARAIGDRTNDSYFEFQSLAQSVDGAVMYAGTSGGALWAGRGTVLKCTVGPGVDGTDPADWTDIATGNPFGFVTPFGRTAPFNPPSTWDDQFTADRLTFVEALAVSPYENDVVFAGLFQYASIPQEGLWVYNYDESGTWEVFPPTSTLSGMSVQAMAFPPGAATQQTARLVCGTNGQELFFVPIPKPPTGGGPGGGCPYVYVFDGSTYREDNTILAPVTKERAGGADASVVDRYVLQQPLVAQDGRLRIEIREFENEHSYIDRVELVAVDHPHDTEITVMEDGKVAAQREWIVPVEATTGDGVDVLAAVAARDASSIRGTAGDYIDLVYQTPKSTLTGIVTDSGEKNPDDPNPTGAGNNTGIEALLLGPNGRYYSLGSFVPRERTSPRALSVPSAVLDGIQAGSQFRIRLQWHSEHELDFAGLLTPVDAELTQHVLSSTTARHSTRVLDSGALDTADERFVELEPGETLALEFDAPPATTEKRSYVLITEGHYVNLGRTPETLPTAFRTYPNVPNPFNPTTTIRFDLPSQEHVSIRVYSVAGQLVKTLTDQVMPGGRHSVTWDGRNNQGAPLSSGIYFYKVSTRFGTETRKMTLLK